MVCLQYTRSQHFERIIVSAEKALPSEDTDRSVVLQMRPQGQLPEDRHELVRNTSSWAPNYVYQTRDPGWGSQPLT